MRRHLVIRGLFVLLLGFAPLINMLGNARLKGLHGADILQIVAVGFCFGVGFGLLVSAKERLRAGRPEEVQGR